MNYISQIYQYIPNNEQEQKDLEVMKEFIKQYPDTCLTRENSIGHFSASAWIVNKDCTKVLLNYHNIYKNWGWLGGHADGEEDLDKVALREAKEESGLIDVELIYDFPVSVEILPVAYHYKKGKFVNSHLHLNLTYLLLANEADTLHIKPDENSGLRWVELNRAVSMTNEEAMKPIYKKLNDVVEQYKKSREKI